MCHTLRSALWQFSPSLKSFSLYLQLIRYVTLWPWPLTLWPWKYIVHLLSRDQIMFQILGKLNNPRWSYFAISISLIWAPSAILNLNENVFSQVRSLYDPTIHLTYEISANPTTHGWVVDDLTNFPSPFLGDKLYPLVLGVGSTELYQIWGEHRSIINASAFLDLRYVAPFHNQSTSNATGAENRGQILHFLTPVKLRWAKSLIYFWQSADRLTGRSKYGCQRSLRVKTRPPYCRRPAL